MSSDHKRKHPSRTYRARGQMSEAFLTAAFLSVSGGLQDAYTYMFRGKVFANAQTGNIVLLSQCIYEKNWMLAMHYFVPLAAFAMGVVVAEWIREAYLDAKNVHWRQIVLLSEMLLLFIVGFLPERFNVPANALVSFSCAMQVQAFRKVNGYAFSSTMCIGNIRSGMEALAIYMRTHDRKMLKKSLRYLEIIFLFGVGAGLGGHLVTWFGAHTIWFSCMLLMVGFCLMFIKEGIEEHPEIRQEEEAIRKDLQDIGKKAADVEHLIEEDIRNSRPIEKDR